MIAAVLTEVTGHTYTAVHLWGSEQGGSRQEKTATDDLLGRRSLTEILATAAAWTATEPREQAVLHPATGAALFGAVWDATRQGLLHTFPGAGREEVIPEFMDVLESHLRGLRRLDDTAGGGALPSGTCASNSPASSNWCARAATAPRSASAY